MNMIHEFLGEKRTSALLSHHRITCCDTSGKFNYKSKEHWVKLTNGAFQKHLCFMHYAFIQIPIWANADTALIPVTEPIEFG